MSPRLTIELVPKTCWYSNVRSEVSSDEWDIIRRRVYIKSGYKCEICSGVGPKHPVECHEVWNYDDLRKIQKLKRMIALCPACHRVKHIGYAGVIGKQKQAIQHLADVNGWSYSDAELYVEDCFEVWARRSNHTWTLDISHLDVYNTR